MFPILYTPTPILLKLVDNIFFLCPSEFIQLFINWFASSVGSETTVLFSVLPPVVGGVTVLFWLSPFGVVVPVLLVDGFVGLLGLFGVVCTTFLDVASLLIVAAFACTPPTNITKK